MGIRTDWQRGTQSNSLSTGFTELHWWHARHNEELLPSMWGVVSSNVAWSIATWSWTPETHTDTLSLYIFTLSSHCRHKPVSLTKILGLTVFGLEFSLLERSITDFYYFLSVLKGEQGQTCSCSVNMLEFRDRRKQTYFSSAVWAAMRVRSDLSARGQPDRLEDRWERECQKNQTENMMSWVWVRERVRGGLGNTHSKDRS